MNELLVSFLEASDYRIDGGQEWLWSCWTGARFIDVSNDFGSASIVIDFKNNIVYQMEVCPEDDTIRPYRWTNPDYAKEYREEAKARNIDDNIAWDEVHWSDTELTEDFLEKMYAILHGEEFDPRIMVSLDIDTDVFNLLAQSAHEKDITINQLINDIIIEYLSVELKPIDSEFLKKFDSFKEI